MPITRHVLVLLLTAAGLAACAAGPTSAPGEHGPVAQTAPRLADFGFAEAAMAPASDFDRWRSLAVRTAAGADSLEACLADKKNCGDPELLKFRRLIELARALTPVQQLKLIQAYFNGVPWTGEDRDTWLSLTDVIAGRRGDCEDVALAKYQTLRRLGWGADKLRVVVGWDAEERDWHAWLVVDNAGTALVLDSIKEPEPLRRFRASRAVYSISELGFWDHAPDFVPVASGSVPERAARLAALDRKGDPS